MGSSPNISETLPACAEDEWCSGFVYLAFFLGGGTFFCLMHLLTQNLQSL